ncbi:hypothetical protein NQ317_013137 [Molorchus minor]|uniref:BACK domain-containing protein n=1 Tax=Molorchus minor TaxID=1323400 RepID=A0ABQ9J1V2_9CUCU|nr:hypothetical protein NQ317_013137 [Molorchus minor]
MCPAPHTNKEGAIEAIELYDNISRKRHITSRDTVLATLYVAKKYFVPHLARACVNYLETSLTAKNACLLLSQSRLFEEPELMQRCWEVIEGAAALKSREKALDISSIHTRLMARVWTGPHPPHVVDSLYNCYLITPDQNAHSSYRAFPARWDRPRILWALVSRIINLTREPSADAQTDSDSILLNPLLRGKVVTQSSKNFKTSYSVLERRNDETAEMALKSDGFVDIDMSTLESVLGRETLNCKEMNLLEAALNWAAAECGRREIEPTPQNKRAVLGNALYLIRIPTMTLEEFANGAAQIGILTQQETIDIFFHFTANNKPSLHYPIKPRAGLKSQVCHRFQSCAYRSNQWRYRGRCDSIQFSVDRRIFVVGFGLYGSSNGAADYSVKIELKRLGRILAENNTKFFSDGSSNTFHVYFDNPIQIEPESFYTASAILDGGELSYFGQEGMSEVTVGQVTFQFQCSSESTNGTGCRAVKFQNLYFTDHLTRNTRWKGSRFFFVVTVFL